MNVKDRSKPSVTNLGLFDALSDDEIDTSDAPALGEDFFAEATWWQPQPPVQVVIEIEPDILAWFQAQGDDYQRRLTAALRLYMVAHKSFVREQQIAHTMS